MKVKGYTIKPNADLQGADLQDARLEGVNLQCADLQGANLWHADLRNADLQCADLQDANVEGADLQGANLWYADLRNADLRNANLHGANLTRCKGVQAFYLGMHFGFAFKYRGRVYVKIGCESHTLSHWLKNADKIGKRNRYSDELIRHYKIQLNAIKEMHT